MALRVDYRPNVCHASPQVDLDPHERMTYNLCGKEERGQLTIASDRIKVKKTPIKKRYCTGAYCNWPTHTRDIRTSVAACLYLLNANSNYSSRTSISLMQIVHARQRVTIYACLSIRTHSPGAHACWSNVRDLITHRG